MDTLGLVFENSMKIASDWLTFALDASYVRAVVFGVPIGGMLKVTDIFFFSFQT